MHDIKFIRNNPQAFNEAMHKRNAKVTAEEILKLDTEKRELTTKLDEMRSRRNAVSKEIGQSRKKGIDTTELQNEMKELGHKLKSSEEREKELNEIIHDELLKYPNIPAEDTPDGLSEADNLEIKTWGDIPAFDFKVKDHLELAERLDILDFKRGSKITGSGFPVWKGMGARLERALLNFMLDYHRENGYSEVMTPFVANRESLTASGQIPKLEEDMYLCEKEDYFLIPTSETTLINLHRNEILHEKDLPIAYTAFSPCFRREAGAYGADTRGFLRTHQFNKVEMLRFEKPENSWEIWELMLAQAEKLLQLLDIPYRVMRLCAGDMGFNAAACFDLEIWAPSDEGNWLEVSSISNCLDFQARRANIRYKPQGGGKAVFPHILNGSGLATSRLFVSLLECNQTEEGSVVIPPALRPYMHNETIITQQNSR